MENEENRGLIDKKASKDQLVILVSLVLLDLSSILSLSLLNTQSFLGALWHWIKEGKEGKRKEEARKEEQDEATTTIFFVGADLHVYFICYIWHSRYCI